MSATVKQPKRIEPQQSGPRTHLQAVFVRSVSLGSLTASRIGGAIAGIVWGIASHFLTGLVGVGGFLFGFLLFCGFAIGCGWLVSWVLRGGK